MRNREGFTLIELMVVTIVIGVLATMSIASFSGLREKSMIEATRVEIRTVITSAERYRAVHGLLPVSLDQLVDAGFHQKSRNIDYCTFTQDAGPPLDLVIEAAHRGSPIHLRARYPSAGVTMQRINEAADCS